MRSVTSCLVGVAAAGLLGTCLVVGCSADGTAGDFDEPTRGTTPTDPASSQLPASSNGGGETPSLTDAGKRPDAGKPGVKADAGKDAAPPAPEEGEPCATPNVIFKRSCQLCGTQEAVCLASEDGGPNQVSPYGDCTNQVKDGCEPGTEEESPCGDCGTLKRTCGNKCTWTSTACLNQPQDHCTPGAVELLTAGCPADQYRQKVCKPTCIWDNVSAVCSAAPSYVLVPATPGSTNSTIAVLRSTQTAGRLFLGSCPGGSYSTIASVLTPYAYVEVRNTNPKAVTVSIYNSQASATSPIIDTIMAAYDGVAIPSTDAERKKCIKGVADDGNTALTGNTTFASLDGARAVTIAAGASVQVYFASYPAYDASSPKTSTGMVKLSVRTESVAP